MSTLTAATPTPTRTPTPPHPVVSPEQWLAARRELLKKEKQLTRLYDGLRAERLKLPWVRVDKPYAFDAPGGRASLADLFGGRSQLLVYHFMFGPGWAEGCPSCSFLADHLDPMVPHLAARDVSLVVVSRAPLPQIQAFQARMGWRFPWVSSFGNDFNRDYHVSFTKEETAAGNAFYNYEPRGFPSEEGPGASAFYKDAAGTVFHTYSGYTRGVEPLIGTYMALDLVPRGRDENGYAFTMQWVRHHDRYGDGYAPDATKAYAPSAQVPVQAPAKAQVGSCCGGEARS